MEGSAPRDPAPGLTNGLRIMEYVGRRGRAGFSELLGELELNKASLSRFLKVLTDRGYLAKEGTAYLPGLKLAGPALSRPWEPLIHPLLSRVSRECFCSVLWVEYERGEMVFVDRVVREDGASVHSAGTRGSHYLVNPAGYILLASLAKDQADFLRESGLYNGDQSRRIPTGDWIEARLEEVRDRGWFDDRGEIIPAIRRWALPFSPEGVLRGALVMAVLDQTVDDGAAERRIQSASRILARVTASSLNR